MVRPAVGFDFTAQKEMTRPLFPSPLPLSGSPVPPPHTVAQIAAEFGVTRPTIYRHIAKLHATADS
jgi:hypothetical protein